MILLPVLDSSTPAFAAREAGGKGHNLYLLTKLGLPVPPWVVLGRSFFDRAVKAAGLRERLDAILGEFAAGTLKPAEAERRIESLLVTEARLPEEVERGVREALERLGPGKLSVRSSASDEDGAAHSFAGQLSSYLYVEGFADVLTSLRRCWASAFSERALVYRRENRIRLDGIGIAVVLQKMIDPESSGVLFTCDPVAETLDQYLVTSVYGVGEGLVSGALDSDSFWLDARTGAVAREEIAEKSEAFRGTGSGRAEARPVPEALRTKPSLDANQLRRLFEAGQKILAAYNRPQDVEWAWAEGQLWILQARAVTTLKRELLGFLNLWDNSNIIESYGGLTSPLSFSFALRNYRNVYVQFCEVLGVPGEIIKDMDDYLGNMLGCLHGRVFYNLYNWYKLVGILPGFKQNREFMETMMGVSEALSAEITERIQPHPSWETGRGKLRKARTGLNFLYYHFAIQGIVDEFLVSFHKDYLRYRNVDYRRLRGDQVVRAYIEMERNMMGRWKAPIINDFLCMVHFGTLRKLTVKWLTGLDSTIQNDLLAGEGNLESAEPTKALIRLAGEVMAEPGLRALIESAAPADALEALHQSPYQKFFAKVLDYIDRFGFRCMNEMKLEEIDLYTDSSYFFVCLKNYLRSGVTDLHAMEAREKKLRSEAEAKVAAHLSGWRKPVFNWVLKHARKAVKNRENTRFARTRIYGVGRSMFQAMGEDLAARRILEQPRDIFFLSIEEVFGIFQGTLTTTDLPALVRLRREAYARYESEEPKARVTSRGPVYWANPLLQSEDDAPSAQASADGSADLTGLPCCPGIVEGIVKVVMSPTDDLNLNGEILVTPRTDPGWVPLYPSITGLLVERGSLLSHSAIVAREMGLPAIVSVPGLVKTLKNGMRVRMDGKAGTVKILEGSG